MTELNDHADALTAALEDAELFLRPRYHVPAGVALDKDVALVWGRGRAGDWCLHVQSAPSTAKPLITASLVLKVAAAKALPALRAALNEARTQQGLAVVEAARLVEATVAQWLDEEPEESPR